MITINLYYKGTNGSARRFADEMDQSGTADAINRHHASPMMKTISDLREKYDLHMTVERYVTAQENAGDERFIKK